MDKHTLFISDMHLSANEPAVLQTFLLFLEEEARQADALYMLGDSFDAWIGDDDISPFAEQVIRALKALSVHTPIYVMHGNRDFLLGERFARATGCTLISDPTVIDLYGRPTLLSHGDSLCLDDVRYQRFRKHVRKASWQRSFLSMPVKLRRMIARRIRKTSHNQQQNTLHQDISIDALLDMMQAYQTDCCIHGHTHKPHIYQHKHNTKTYQRFVLGAWDYHGHRLLYDQHGGYSLDSLRRRR